MRHPMVLLEDTPRVARHRTGTCRFGGRCGEGPCRAPVGEGERFCAAHALLLTTFATEIKQETEKHGRFRRGPGGAPRCCTAGCENPRGRGEHYCFDCRQAGMDDEDAA